MKQKKRCNFQLKKYFLNIMHHLHARLLGSMILALLVFFLSFSSLLPPFPGIRGWLVSKWIAAAAAVSPFLHISSTDFNQKGKKNRRRYRFSDEIFLRRLRGKQAAS